MKKKMLCLLLAVSCMVSLLTACSKQSESEHEALTICSPFRDVNAFIEVVHKYHSEINFEVIPYAGNNATAYMQGQLRSGQLPDIYTTSVYAPGQFDSADKLIDLSKYSFTDNYVPARLREAASDDGSIYMLPTYFNAIGITYNKKLLEENGWELPTSLKEMETLAPKVKEAGYIFCLNQLQFPGYGFQYLCNILDTGYFNTLEGRKWQNKFLNGEANIENTPEMKEEIKLLQKWYDIGLLNNENAYVNDADVAAEMAKGNTLFMLGSSNDFTKFGADPNDFALMPYLSEDGNQNIFMINTTRFVGLSKELEKPENKQKLEDAIAVMEILSTDEGMEAMNSAVAISALSPLKNAAAIEGSYYTQGVLDQINAGYTAPFIYAGWENVIVEDGEAMLSYIRGEISLEELTTTLDESQKLINDNSSQIITNLDEPISQDDCAYLVGYVFTKASNADLALISRDVWFYDNHGDGNKNGVSGQLFALPVTDLEITSILPTGWNGNIKTYTFSGKRIKELLDQGYDYKNQGRYYPYQLVCKDGLEIEDDKNYTVVICGATEDIEQEGNVKDSGILGLDAMKQYLGQFDVFHLEDIKWE